jgi:hypothetical protein
MRQVFGDFGLWIAAIAIAWTLALLCYFASGSVSPEKIETRVNTIVRDLDSSYAGGATTDQKRHVILAMVLREQSTTLWEGVFLHLSIAFGVAGMLILGVEGVARYRTGREFREQLDSTRRELKEQADAVSRSVWNAIFHRFVPDEVSHEIENILKAKICRLHPRYVIKFPRDAYQNIPEDYIVVRREVHYRVTNLTSEQTEWPFRLRVVSHTRDSTLKDHAGQDVTLPAIKSVSIGGKPIKIENPKELIRTEVLNRRGSDGDTLDVVSVVEELLGITDRTNYIHTTPAVGLSVTIVNEISDILEVQDIYLSSGRDKLSATLPDHWDYDGAVMPGIALLVSWRKKEPPPTAGGTRSASH